MRFMVCHPHSSPNEHSTPHRATQASTQVGHKAEGEGRTGSICLWCGLLGREPIGLAYMNNFCVPWDTGTVPGHLVPGPG